MKKITREKEVKSIRLVLNKSTFDKAKRIAQQEDKSISLVIAESIENNKEANNG